MTAPKTTATLRNPAQQTATLARGADIVYLRVSPCSLNPGYGLQFTLSLVERACNAECESVLDRAVNAAALGREALLDAAQERATAWLEAHGTEPLKTAAAKWAQAKADFDEDNAKWAAREAKRVKARNAKRKAQGYTHRVLAWIHPEQGDDYQVEAYVMGAPTPADIAKLLKASAVKDDFKVEELS